PRASRPASPDSRVRLRWRSCPHPRYAWGPPSVVVAEVRGNPPGSSRRDVWGPSASLETALKNVNARGTRDQANFFDLEYRKKWLQGLAATATTTSPQQHAVLDEDNPHGPPPALTDVESQRFLHARLLGHASCLRSLHVFPRCCLLDL